MIGHRVGHQSGQVESSGQTSVLQRLCAPRLFGVLEISKRHDHIWRSTNMHQTMGHVKCPTNGLALFGEAQVLEAIKQLV